VKAAGTPSKNYGETAGPAFFYVSFYVFTASKLAAGICRRLDGCSQHAADRPFHGRRSFAASVCGCVLGEWIHPKHSPQNQAPSYKQAWRGTPDFTGMLWM